MSPTFKIFTLVLGLFLLACGMAAIAQTAGNVVVSWTYPTVDTEGNPIPSTDSTGATNAVTNVYVYYGATATTMTQQATVPAPAASYTMTLAPGHYCFSATMQNAYGVSPFAATICGDVTATGFMISTPPAPPSSFGAQ